MNELYVVFQVANAEYALAASGVSQLESYQGATPVPGSAPHVAGIVQVRGSVIPVIDLRRLFGVPSIEPTLDSRVVVAEHAGRRVGLLVDKSREVLRLDATAVIQTPAVLAQHSHGFFAGVVQFKDRLIMLLAVSELVGEETRYDESRKRLDSKLDERPSLPDGTVFEPARDDGGADPPH